MLTTRTPGALLLAVLLSVATLVGCGGGGGSGGGSTVSPVGQGAAKPGTEAVSTSKSAALQAASGPEGEPSLTAQGATGPGLGAQAISARLNDADSRNGVYYVYAADGTNGTRQKLGINFDTRSYTLTNTQGQATSGTFSEDAAEPGTYAFASDRLTSAVNTSRFRITSDAIVGAFPFEKPWSSPVTYQVMPFVAARAFVTDPAQLDGVYNRFGVSRNSNGTSDSQILAMRISGRGTTLEMCFDNAIYRIESCPVASKRTYAVTASPDFAWTAINLATSSDLLQFRMARIGGQNVWLSGGYTDAAPDIHVFRVGLPDSPNWPRIRYAGASTEGSWGTNVLDATASVRSAITPEGIAGDLSLPVAATGGPAGIRILNAAGPKKYFAIQNGVLSVIVGTRNPDTQGYIQVNLVKDQLDARSGQYTVFAASGTEQKLNIDFDGQRYAMTAPGGDTAAGTFSEDPSDPGTYVFASERIETAVNTARFRVTSDAIVGAFPFSVFKSVPVAYAVQPFIAARSFVTNKSELAGRYDVLTVSGNSNNVGFMGAQYRLHINDSGTIATQCAAGTSPCQAPVDSMTSYDYSISAGASPGLWLLTSSGGTPAFALRVAKIGGRNILLEAKETVFLQPSPTEAVWLLLTGFRQPASGTADAAWPSLTMHSFSTASTFGTAFTEAGSYETRYVQSDGASAALTLTLQSDLTNSQVRLGTDAGGARFLVLQNGAMTLMMPMGPAINHLHIGLAD